MKLSEKRIQVLEEKAGIGAPAGTTVFLMRFSGEITGARSAGSTWAREAGETIDGFQERLSRDVPGAAGNTLRIIQFFGEPGDGTFSEADIL